MGFFSSIFKGIKKVIKGIGKVIKKVVKSKAFKVVAAVGLALVAPQLLPNIVSGLSAAGSWAATTIAKGATLAWSGITAAGSAIMSGARAAGSAIMKGGGQIFRSVTETISSGIKYMQGKIASGIDYTKEMLGFGPKTLVSGPAYPSGTEFVKGTGKFVSGPKYPKAPFSWKKFGKEAFIDPLKDALTDTVKKKAKEALGDEEEPEMPRELSLLMKPSYDIESVGDYDSSKGYGALENLAKFTASPYVSYHQGQQLFANPPGLVAAGSGI